MNKLFTAIVVASSVCACVGVSGTVNEPNVCTDYDFDLPPNANIPAGVNPSLLASLPPVTVSKSFTKDFSGNFSKLTDIGDLHVGVNSNVITVKAGNWSWVDHFALTVKGNANRPTLVLMDHVLTPAEKTGTTLDMTVLVSGDALLDILKSGPMDLTASVTGHVPSVASGFFITTCMNASITVDKHL